MERLAGLRERKNAFEVVSRVMLVLSSSCWELIKFLESSAALAWNEPATNINSAA